MAQFKIYGHKEFIEQSATSISHAIHQASQDALGMPPEKRFHRFLPLETWQFIAPPDRSGQYIIIELLMFEGRPVATKKAFYAALLRNLNQECGIADIDIELTITESPLHDWLIRGLAADELSLNYDVNHGAGDQ